MVKHYKTVHIFLALFLLALVFSCRKEEQHVISILGTTDLHGVISPYDFIEKEKLNASLAGISAYIAKTRKESDELILLDNGDNLQGQPSVYYYNFIDTVTPHFLAEAMNWLKYDACTIGNHDLEAGHSVYDRLVNDYNFPLLAANAVDIKTGKPYFKPYAIIEREKVKIAVLGLITPAVPTWLPEKLYSGIEFRDMVETAESWMPEIRRQKPDLIIGLFHSGWNSDNEEYKKTEKLNENGSAAVAYNVPGFDIIFTGHDHRLANEKFINKNGDTILIMNAGSRSENLARADVKFTTIKGRSKRQKSISGKIIDIKDYKPDPVFVSHFKSYSNQVNEYVNKVIGNSVASISSRDSYFGSSSFVDMIHSIQLEITGADISFAAPLSFDVSIRKGPVTVGDMFKLYRFENMLYTISMTGDEISDYLEFSYGEWLSTMTDPDDYLLNYRLGKNGKPVLTNGKAWLQNQPYNFDSAAGIDYIVDARLPEGERVTIISFTDGRPFDREKRYKVALNSYRGNGGGGHLTRGAGLKNNQIRERLLTSTDRDLRYFIMKSIEARKIIEPVPLNNWKIIPEAWVGKARTREQLLLFGATK